MAFATSNIRAGTIGNLKLIAGDWTGTAGDANGIFAKQRGRLYLADFSSSQDVGTSQEIPTMIASTTTLVANIGVANRKTVTAGRFLIIHA